MKKLLSSCILGSAMLCAMATEGTITYTYAGNDFGSWGKNKSEIYDAAIRIEDASLVGKKITGIRAVLNAYEGIESTSLWLSKELTLEKIDGVKVTVPDVYATNIDPEKISLPGVDGEYGQLSTTLSEPYVITEEGIYVGYSLTVPAVDKGEALTSKQKNPLMFSSCSNPKSLYLRTSKDFLNWLAYNSKLEAAAMIYVTIEGEFEEYSVGLKSLTSTYSAINEAFSIKAEISTPGLQNVSSIDYSYTVGGKKFDKILTFDTPIPADFVNTTSIEFPIDAVSELGEFTIDLTINKVNGNANVNPVASASCGLTVLPFVPVHRPMLEEFTGTWCGWCIRGYLALEMLGEMYGDNIVLAAYHYGNQTSADPMQVTKEYPVSTSGFPSASLNRGPIIDPYYGDDPTSTSDFQVNNNVKESMETVAPAEINVKAYWGNEEKTEVKVAASATFFENTANAGYKIGYLLINNGLSGTGSGWIQSNYLANDSVAYRGTPLEVLTTWPSKVPNLVFNDVVVDATAMKGVKGSVPSEIIYNQTNDSEYSFDIASNSVIQDKDKLYVAAFIINPNGTILNANKAKVDGFTAVKALEDNAAEVSAEYYNLSGARVAAPQQGIYVKVAKMSDGSIRTSKVAVK